MAETDLHSPRGMLTILRPHTAATSPLRAWSAADQLVLDHLGLDDLGRVLIVNDEFGALTCGLAATNPVVWTDSVLSRRSIDANLERNGHAGLDATRSIPGDETPTGSFDTVVVRVPKSSALLNHQLPIVRTVGSANVRVVGAGMVRHIHRSTVQAFEQHIGPTTTSLAKRKARLIHATAAGPPAADAALSPPRFMSSFMTEDGLEIIEQPGTFSAGHVDVGSALLIDVLRRQPAPDPGALIVDLGSGNGVLTASAASLWPGPSLQFAAVDTSDLAVAATEQTWNANRLGDRLTATAADGMADFGDATVDVVISNPPFHHGHASDADLTDRLLADIARALRPAGTAYVVVQRHLKLHTRMKRWFGNVDVVSKHPSHVAIIARHPRR